MLLFIFMRQSQEKISDLNYERSSNIPEFAEKANRDIKESIERMKKEIKTKKDPFAKLESLRNKENEEMKIKAILPESPSFHKDQSQKDQIETIKDILEEKRRKEMKKSEEL